MLVLLAGSSIAEAQPVGYRDRVKFAADNHLEPPSGWYVGLGGHTTAFVRQTGGPELLKRGGGLSVYGGLHVTPRATLEFGWTESFHNPAEVETIYGPNVDYLVLDSWTVGSRIYIGPMTNTFSPYVQLGLGVYALSSEYFGLDSSGTGFHVGLGGDFWLSDFLTLGGRIRYRSIAMGVPGAGSNDTFLATTLVEVGIGFHY